MNAIACTRLLSLGSGFHNRWRCVAEGALAVCGRASLLETVLGLDLEKTHPHCRVELARALALAEAAAVERCLSRTEGERDAACVAGLQLLAAEKGVGFISFLLLAPTPALCAHHRKAFTLLPSLSSVGGCLQADGGAGGAAGRAPRSRAGHRGGGRPAERGHDDCGDGAAGAGAPGGNREWRGGRGGRCRDGAAEQSVNGYAVTLSLPTVHCTRSARLETSRGGASASLPDERGKNRVLRSDCPLPLRDARLLVDRTELAVAGMLHQAILPEFPSFVELP